MTVNATLLNEIVDFIEAHPSEWDQAAWAKQTPCGTAFCVAGHAANMTGHKPVFNLRGKETVEQYIDYYGNPPTAETTEDGYVISDIAREELGLDSNQAACLFSGENTLPQVRAMANLIIVGADLDGYMSAVIALRYADDYIRSLVRRSRAVIGHVEDSVLMDDENNDNKIRWDVYGLRYSIEDAEYYLAEG